MRRLIKLVSTIHRCLRCAHLFQERSASELVEVLRTHFRSHFETEKMNNNEDQHVKTLTKEQQWFGAFYISIGGIGIGLCFAWTATALSSIQETEQLVKQEGLSPLEKSLVGSVLFFGALLGCPFAAYTMNTVGRKVSLLQLAPLATLGWLAIAMATTPGHLYLGRLLTGFYVGGCSVVIPVYVNELASKENQAVLGSLLLIMLCLGKFISNLVGILVSASNLALVCALQPIIHILCLLFVSDSPVALTPQHKKVKLNFRKVSVISSDFNQSNDQSGPPVDAPTRLSLGDVWFQVCTVFILAFLTQLTGANVVTFFTTEMFQTSFNTPTSVGTSGITNADIGMILLAAAQVAGGLPCGMLVNRCGRKTLLLYSQLTMTVSLVGLSGYYFFFSDIGVVDQSQIGFQNVAVPLAFLVVLSVSCCWGTGSVFWIIMTEIVPSEISAIISSLVNMLCCISAFTVTLLYQLYSAQVPLYFWFLGFAVVSFGGGLFINRFLPETKGLTLLEIQNHYKSKTVREANHT